jgi:hypothetical protein
MRQYLSWQVFAIGQHWHLLYKDPANKLLVRQLRVRIRRLRSCFVFFREGLPETETSRWQDMFREEADRLSTMRELDVAAQMCQRRRDAEGETNDVPSPLLDHFLQLREDEEKKVLPGDSLNNHTEKLAEFLLWMDGMEDIVPKGIAGEPARQFVDRRLGEWADGLLALKQKYPDFSNMDDLHKIRIKVKRFRYVTQTIDLARLPLSLLRQLKLENEEGREQLYFHQQLLNDRLPLSIGGGIGQSRLCMVLLHKGHIGEIQASIWPDDMRKECKQLGMNLI